MTYLVIVLICAFVAYVLIQADRETKNSALYKSREEETRRQYVELKGMINQLRAQEIKMLECALRDEIFNLGEKLEERDEQLEERVDRKFLVVQRYLDDQALNKRDGKYLEKKIKETNRKIYNLADATQSGIQQLSSEVQSDIHELAVMIADHRFGDDEGGEGAYER